MNKRLAFLLAAGCLLAACAAPAGANEGFEPQAWFDAPLHESQIPLAPYEIVIHAASPQGVSSIELLIVHKGEQSQPAIQLPVPSDQLGKTLVIVRYMWTPTAIGDYTIQARAAGLDGAYGKAAEPIVHVVNSIDEGIVPVVEEQPATILIAIPSRNANCRIGPSSSVFEIDDTLLFSIEYPPLAQGPDSLWILFQGPVSLNPCWALAENIDLLCNQEPVSLPDPSPCSLQMSPYPIFPTPTPTITPEPGVTQSPTNPPPQCADGIDNDGDGKIDYQPPSSTGSSGDPQCSGAGDDSES